ncbi:30S ribosomal protein S4 [Candidatus Microgenomates bacterium]|nr:30S ribosomal protein S4 [Candidatus Microgenomates bacterium]
MARDLAPIVKRSRREGVALHPKAHKVMVRRKSLPGQQVGRRQQKPSQYGIQLREKQKVKRIYGLVERPFRKLVSEAERQSGVTGEMLLQFLERRLDNVIYRLHLAPSRQAARQLVSHGHIVLNGRRVDIPSLRLDVGDAIKVRPGSLSNHYFKQLKEQDNQQSAKVSWLSFDSKALSAKVTGLPTREEAEPDINEHLIVEYYSR